MDLGLVGRRAIVTGGSKGIGFAVAQELATEGAHVAICARHPDEVQQAVERLRGSGTTVYGQTADMSTAAGVEDFIPRAIEELGGIDILVNNAGRAHPGTFDQLTDEDWQSDLDVKLFSMIRCSRAVIPGMRASGGGRIININAVYGKYPDPHFFATSVDRAACLSLTKTLAMEVGTDNILVNSVNIGFVLTPQWKNVHQRRAPDLPEEEFLRRMAADEVPLGRFGRADEVSGIVAFLAGNRSSYITGASIDVAGGMGKYL